MLEVLRASLGLPIALAGMWAVGMMIYTLSQSLSAAEIENKRRWKRRYYKWMMMFALVWVFLLILMKFGR
jgi:hypothetical protein